MLRFALGFQYFFQISLYFFICQKLCWMRDLCISFKSCFLFPVGRGCNFFWGGRDGVFLLGGSGVGWGGESVPHYMPWLWSLQCQKWLIFFVFPADESKKSVTSWGKCLRAPERSY